MIALENLIDPQSVLATTEALVRIPSHPGILEQETGVAQYLAGRLSAAGIDARLEPVVDGRANLIARLPGTGGGRSLLLCGHTDTVPPYDMPEALAPRWAGDRLIGRGTADMKSALAAMLEAMLAIQKSGLRLKGDLIFAGVIDEERKSCGAVDLIEKGIRADAAIVGEPSDGKLCVSHRGLEWFDFFFKGRAVHGGRQTRGINAILKAAHFIHALEAELLPELAGRVDLLMGASTLNIGRIYGGTQPSTVAGECRLSIDRRFLPSEDHQAVCNELQAIVDRLAAADTEFSCEMMLAEASRMKIGYVHLPLARPADEGFITLLKEKIDRVYGRETEIAAFPAWSDAGLLAGYAGTPTVVFGPGMLECCHSAGEYVETQDMARASQVYANFAVGFCG